MLLVNVATLRRRFDMFIGIMILFQITEDETSQQQRPRAIALPSCSNSLPWALRGQVDVVDVFIPELQWCKMLRI